MTSHSAHSTDTAFANAVAASEIAVGVTLERLYDGRMACFTIRTNARESLETWFNTCLQLMDNWPQGRTYLVLSDIAYEGAAFTPLIRSYAQRLIRYRPELRQYVALIVPNTFTVRLVRLVIQAQRRNNVETRLFFTRQEGLNWLKSKL